MFAIVDTTTAFGRFGGVLIGPPHDTWFSAARYLLSHGLRATHIIVEM